MPTITVATRNAHKVEEMLAILRHMRLTLQPLTDGPAALRTLALPEDCETLEGNAIKKAFLVSRAVSGPALADDSGFFVPALGGEPGVLSARYLGEGAAQSERNASIIERLAARPGASREASFRCVIALVDVAGGLMRTFPGECRGTVAHRPAGDGGFGYDPIFVPDGDTRSMAQLSPEEKNGISHRSRALAVFAAAVAADPEFAAIRGA